MWSMSVTSGSCEGLRTVVIAAVGEVGVVLDVGGRREQLEVVLALQTLAHDVHVQQTEEAAAKAETEGVRRLRHVAEARHRSA